MKPFFLFLLGLLPLSLWAQPHEPVQLHPRTSGAMQLALGGHSLVYHDRDSLYCLDLRDSVLTARLPLSLPVSALAVTTDGKQAWLGHPQGAITVADLETGTMGLRHTYASHPISALAVDSAGKHFAWGTTKGRVEIWQQGPEPQLVHALRGIEGEVTSLLFDGSGRYLITAGQEPAVRVWEVSRGQVYKTLLGHEGWVHCLALSADGKRVASAGKSGIIFVWQIAGEQVFTPRHQFPSAHQGPVAALALPADDYFLISAGHDNRLALYPLREELAENHQQLKEQRVTPSPVFFPPLFQQYLHRMVLVPGSYRLYLSTTHRGLWYYSYFDYLRANSSSLMNLPE